MIIENQTHPEFMAGHGTIGTTATKASALQIKAYHSVKIKADSANTDNVYVGQSDQVTSTNGYQLDAGEEVEIPVDRLDKVWVIGGAAAQGYSWLVA